MSSPGKSNKESAKTTRQRAAEARAKAEAEAKRRDNRNRVIGVVIVVVLIGLIFGGVWFARKDGGSSAATPDSVPSAQPDPSAALPKTVDAATFGVPWGTGTDAVPQLQIWEDFQCPACGQLEATFGTQLESLGEDGTVRLLWRPANLIDNNFGTTYSQQATAAWGCAIDAGKTKEFHNTVYANQPATEGDGWTQAQLLQFGKDAGITGDAYTTFESCVQANTYVGWAANSFQDFRTDGISHTPTAILVMGDRTHEVKDADWIKNGQYDLDTLKATIADFAKG